MKGYHGGLDTYDFVHLGSGTGMSLNEIVATIAREVGPSPAEVTIEYRPLDYQGRDDNANYEPPVQIADCRKAREVLGYQPCYPMWETIRTTVAYLKARGPAP